jgi:hypothetical protein
MEAEFDGYALLIFNSIESFGEVAVLLDFADAIASKYRCLFLSLDVPNSRVAAINATGHETVFLFDSRGHRDEALISRLHAAPPLFAVASDYSQFNVWCDSLPKTLAGEALLNDFRVRHGMRAAVSDLAGLSLECTLPLRETFDRILIPASGYSKLAACEALPDPRIRIVATEARRRANLEALVNRFQPGRVTVFVSYPRPNGWSTIPEGDPYCRLWVRAVEAALDWKKSQLNVVAFEDLASLMERREDLTMLSGDSPVDSVNSWLAIADIILTPNWCSTLAARGVGFGVRPLITYNDAGEHGLDNPRVHAIAGESFVERLPRGEFDRWLPAYFGSCWPGVRTGLESMIQNARQVPLFRPDVLAGAIAAKGEIGPGLSPNLHVHSPIAVANELMDERNVAWGRPE